MSPRGENFLHSVKAPASPARWSPARSTAPPPAAGLRELGVKVNMRCCASDGSRLATGQRHGRRLVGLVLGCAAQRPQAGRIKPDRDCPGPAWDGRPGRVRDRPAVGQAPGSRGVNGRGPRPIVGVPATCPIGRDSAPTPAHERSVTGREPVVRPTAGHRPEPVAALSRWRHGFESRWGCQQRRTSSQGSPLVASGAGRCSTRDDALRESGHPVPAER